MRTFLKRLFGRGEPASGDGVAEARSTVRDSAEAESASRLKPIASDQFTAPEGRRRASQPEDTGPWFIGKTVGEIYQIRGVLGRGGMGIVYRAYDTATHREIAVKVPLGKFVDDEDCRKRFTREAEIWSGLIYPHIVQAFDVRDDQTTDYRPAVFMNLCQGGSLADRLRRGMPLPMADGLDIAIQVCWAMEFAHQQGLIHRDLKPGNVLLSDDGKALVSDFGLVKAIELEELEVTETESEDRDEAVEASLTRGLAMGTPEYMPPEQWRGQVCPQSDIYAFGILLYELFCGGRPFSAPRRGDLWIPHSKVPPPDPRRRNGQVPAELAELMVQCLAKEPSERPPSFATVAQRLSASYQRIAGEAYGSRRAPPSAGEVSRDQRKGQASALIRLGNGCRLRGDLDDAMRQLGRACDIFRQIGDQWALSAGLGNQAVILADRGDLDGAMKLCKEKERICRELGNKDGLRASVGNQALILYARGDLDGAMKLYKEQERICRELGNVNGLAISLANQASLWGLGMGRPRDALPVAEEAYRVASGHGLTALAGQVKGILEEVRAAAQP